jgi:hypothetical protein
MTERRLVTIVSQGRSRLCDAEVRFVDGVLVVERVIHEFEPLTECEFRMNSHS